MIQPITIDFETDMIEGRPTYPPRPVGVSIKYFGEAPRYYAWAHPTGNNCSFDEGLVALKTAWSRPARKLFHNAKFDLAVAVEALGLPPLEWGAVDDTMFLLFLADPHSRAIDLKSAAKELLGWEPEERDLIAEWLWEHRKELQQEYPDMPRISKETGKPQANKSSTGCWLSKCPGDLVGPYANGDTARTEALFNHLYPLIVESGMLEAYNRERQILPIFMENERLGIRVNTGALERDVERYADHGVAVDEWLAKRLGAPGLNLDADDDVAEALASSGVVNDDQWSFTATGKRSVSKKNLTPASYNDPEVANAFGYRNRLKTCLTMFMVPWLEQSSVNGGCISTNWNQTRGGSGGTRTGRPSTSSPNLLNISKSFEGRTDGYAHPEHLAVDKLPLVRNYVLPDEGAAFLHRDFDGQELRIFGHYECGDLYAAYQRDPTLDVHDLVGTRMAALKGQKFERTRVKVVNFQSIYGGGVPALVRELGISTHEAKAFKDFHNKALPGRVILNEEIKRMVRGGDPIRTWGGRCYFPEEPRRVDGRYMDFIYKLLNYLVQGSAADVTKEAIIRWHSHPDRLECDRFLVTVYDEINISAPLERIVPAMKILRECMEGIELDVQMLSSPKVGLSWGGVHKPAKGEAEDAFMARMMKELAA